MLNEFEYSRPCQEITYHGQHLDSLLELRFVLMIEETHAWIRDGLQIYFNIDDLRPGIKDPPIRKYTPDFLIRNWLTGKATLVEVKPDIFDNYFARMKRTKICSDYIAEFGYDWSFKYVWSSQIILNSEKQAKYDAILNKLRRHAPNWIGDTHPNSTGLSNDQYDRFVRIGCLPAPAPDGLSVASHTPALYP
jgi:hypothetical protein